MVKAGTPSRRDGGFALLEALVALAVAALLLPLLVRSIGGAHIRLEALDAAGVRRLEVLYAGAYLRGEWVTYADGWTGEKGAGAVDPDQVRVQPFQPCIEEGVMGPVLAADFGGRSEAGKRRFQLRLDRAADRSATGSYRLRWGKTGEEGTLLEFTRRGPVRTEPGKPDPDRPQLELARFATGEPPSALSDGVRVRWRWTTPEGAEEADRIDVHLAWPVDGRWTVPETPAETGTPADCCR